MQNISEYISFDQPKLHAQWQAKKVPMLKLYEAYFNGEIDFKTGITDFLEMRSSFVKYSFTREHLSWLISHFLPEALIHSKKQDRHIVRNHYDLGNDFFGWFLGERMVYTCGFFENAGQNLEQAQDNKMRNICQSLQLQADDDFLDIGCGWGTLANYATKHYATHSTGISISQQQITYADNITKSLGQQDRVQFECKDYRDINPKTYNKIACVEMVEHVGIKNLSKFFRQIYSLLDDDGLFLLQWCGLRRRFKPEDLIWGMFMSKYIFPGADASLPPCNMLKPIEKAGFEVHSIVNTGIHYSLTIKHWHENWQQNREKITAKYGEKWFRIWNLFLAWSTIIARQGNSTCYQAVLHKNLDKFNRKRWINLA